MTKTNKGNVIYTLFFDNGLFKLIDNHRKFFVQSANFYMVWSIAKELMNRGYTVNYDDSFSEAPPHVIWGC